MSKELPGLAKDDTDRPDEETIRMLVDCFGYRLEAVRNWSRVRAKTVVSHCNQEARIAARRAAVLEAEKDGESSRHQPSIVERLTAADYLAETMETGTLEELSQALVYSGYALTDDEMKRMVGYVIRLFRGDTRPAPAPKKEPEPTSEIPE